MVSPIAIGKVDMNLFDSVAAVPIAKYTNASRPEVLHNVICLITQTLDEGTADPTVAFEVPRATGPTNLFSLRSPNSHLKSPTSFPLIL